MPKIIIPGKSEKEMVPYNLRMACKYCGCVWLPVKGDAFVLDYDTREGNYLKMDCPNCHKETYRWY